jgi:DNA-binding LacI/PurR family transcriptional regulator
MATTMIDIARELKLSRTTVSKVLTGKDDHAIPAATKERVRQAAQSLWYRPNHMARTLRSGRSYLINLLVLHVHPAFYSRLIAAFQSALRESGYDLRIQETAHWTPADWREAAADRWPVDGVIVVESVTNVPYLMEAAQGNLPVVNVGSTAHPDMDHVEMDLYTGTREAIRYLQESGRKRIAYLGPSFVTGTSRGAAYMDSMRDSEATPRFITAELGTNIPERELALFSVADYLGKGADIDAIACFNDELAIGAMRAIKEHGLRVPEDIALIGCDDIDETQYHDPALSSLRYPYDEAAKRAWNMLRRRIEDPDQAKQESVIPSTLVIRKSSAPRGQ